MSVTGVKTAVSSEESSRLAALSVLMVCGKARMRDEHCCVMGSTFSGLR